MQFPHREFENGWHRNRKRGQRNWGIEGKKRHPKANLITSAERISAVQKGCSWIIGFIFGDSIIRHSLLNIRNKGIYWQKNSSGKENAETPRCGGRSFFSSLAEGRTFIRPAIWMSWKSGERRWSIKTPHSLFLFTYVYIMYLYMYTFWKGATEARRGSNCYCFHVSKLYRPSKPDHSIISRSFLLSLFHLNPPFSLRWIHIL